MRHWIILSVYWMKQLCSVLLWYCCYLLFLFEYFYILLFLWLWVYSSFFPVMLFYCCQWCNYRFKDAMFCLSISTFRLTLILLSVWLCRKPLSVQPYKQLLTGLLLCGVNGWRTGTMKVWHRSKMKRRKKGWTKS